MASGEGEEETPGNEPEVDVKEVFQKKYFALKKMCDQVQQTNEKLVNRIHQMKKMIRKFKQERGLLMAKLDHCNDGYSEAQTPAMWEEGPSAELESMEPTAASDSAAADVKPPSMDSGLLLPEAMAPVPSASHQAAAPATSTASADSDAAKPAPSRTSRKTATGFLLFCQHRRHEIQEKYSEEEGQEMPQPELVEALTNQWTSLPLEKRRVYQELAANLTAAPASSPAMQALQEQSPSAASLLGLM